MFFFFFLLGIGMMTLSSCTELGFDRFLDPTEGSRSRQPDNQRGEHTSPFAVRRPDDDDDYIDFEKERIVT